MEEGITYWDTSNQCTAYTGFPLSIGDSHWSDFEFNVSHVFSLAITSYHEIYACLFLD